MNFEIVVMFILFFLEIALCSFVRHGFLDVRFMFSFSFVFPYLFFFCDSLQLSVQFSRFIMFYSRLKKGSQWLFSNYILVCMCVSYMRRYGGVIYFIYE